MRHESRLILPVLHSGARLDVFLAREIDAISRTTARSLILAGHVSVGGRRVRPSRALQIGETVCVEIPPPSASPILPEPIPLTVLYEDEDMLVLDKPAGMVVHPAPGHRLHTLVHALMARYPDLPGIAGTQRPGIVHRLDLDTSGLLMVAKTDRGMRSLTEQLQQRTIKKGYLALLMGTISPPQGVIDASIARDPARRKQMALSPSGRSARTAYVELLSISGHSLVLALPETGRTHQIRVHFASLGRPVAGDVLYGGRSRAVGRQFLHASLLRFARPRDGATLELKSNLPDDLTEALRSVLQDAGISDAGIDRAFERMLRLSQRHFSRDTV